MTSLRVLMVEDDHWVARVNRDLLEEDSSLRVVATATSCAEAERLLAVLHPDLLLLDVYLPDGSGVDLLRAMRARGQVTEVIMLTAANDLDTVQRALALGASDYIIKPFDRARLHDAVQRLQARRRQLGPAQGGVASPALTQARLDRALGVQAHTALPKGIDPDTLARLHRLLEREARSLSAEEVGAQVGVSRVTAWRYLEYLVGVGRAELDFTYGTPGRPTKLYRLSGSSARPE